MWFEHTKTKELVNISVPVNLPSRYKVGGDPLGSGVEFSAGLATDQTPALDRIVTPLQSIIDYYRGEVALNAYGFSQNHSLVAMSSHTFRALYAPVPNLHVIYLDLDGVLFDWWGSMKRHCPTLTMEQHNKSPHMKVIQRKAYLREPNMFRDLAVIPEGVKLLRELIRIQEEVAQYVPIELVFLTGVGSAHPNPTKVAQDKILAVKKLIEDYKLPSYAFRNLENRFIITPESRHKAGYAHADGILIDDYHRNVSEWNQRGHGIMFEPSQIDQHIDYLNFILNRERLI